MPELRDYQVQTLDRVEAAEARGVRRQLIVAATGLGKTCIFVALARRRGQRTLVLAHRDELVQQAAAKVREWWPEAPLGIVKAGQNDVRAHVVIASVQTLARQRRLDQLSAPWQADTILGRAEPFGLVVTDEAHHALADSYQRVYDHLGIGTPDGPLHVGVTATPDRGDGKGLDAMFDEVVAAHDMLWGIAAGYLSDLRGLRVTVEHLDLTGVKMNRGDYEAGETGRRLVDAGAPDAIVAAWLEHALGRRTLVFTPTVASAQAVADSFKHVNVRAECVHGGTPLDERRRILTDFATGTIEVVTNCAVLTEGYDEPRADCIVVARPTKSRALYVQMVGRGTRRHPDKTDCLVLDVVGASEHSLVTVPSLFGIENPKLQAQLGDGTRPLSAIVQDDQAEQVRLGRMRAEEIALFTAVRAAGVAWTPVSDPRWPGIKRYQVGLGKDQTGEPLPTVVLAPWDRAATGWVAGLLMPDGSKQVLIADVPMEMAQGVAEDYVRKSGKMALLATDAAWRTRKPSVKAREFAKKLRIKVEPDWNAGQLSDAIDAVLAERKARRARSKTRAG